MCRVYIKIKTNATPYESLAVRPPICPALSFYIEQNYREIYH